MLLTGNYGLRKPELGEPVDVRDFNYNADIIDAELKRRPTADGGASGLTVEFEEARQLTELTSGDSLRGLFGKLKLAVRKLLELMREMESVKKSVSDGKTLVAGAITGQGVKTAADAAFSVMADNIMAVGNKKYGEGVAAADGRENPSSANYMAGYHAGVIAGGAGKTKIYTGSETVYIQGGAHEYQFAHPYATNGIGIVCWDANSDYNVWVKSNDATTACLGTLGAYGHSGTVRVDWVVW